MLYKVQKNETMKLEKLSLSELIQSAKYIRLKISKDFNNGVFEPEYKGQDREDFIAWDYLLCEIENQIYYFINESLINSFDDE